LTDSNAVKEHPAGFTLVELLVVMVLLALTVSIWYGINFRQRDSFRLRTAARSLHTFFLASRSYALLADQDNECRYLPAARTVEESLRHRQQQLPPGIDVCLSVGGEPLGEPEVLLTFYADGSAAGGPLYLRSGSRQLLLEVDPVLGEVKISVPGDEEE
jgi:prepilin-type N-terminal cleavage/methylation domain-containing protein